ncbi:MAG TPA: DUF362 domain-containing protein [Vicinamibacterales bacterium]|nr:DUF362 domain-containing protein [Vicinamibacterales bacterium]
MTNTIGRRDFLVGAMGVAALTGAACGRRPYDPSAFTRPEKSPVALLPAGSYEANLTDLIVRGARELGVSFEGRRVLLKPNMVEYESGTAINTHPRVIAAAGEAALKGGAREVVVAEGPGHRRDTQYLVTATGLADYIRDLRVRFVDLNHDDVRPVPLASRFMKVEEMSLPVELLASDLVVSMPKLKTHHWAAITCSMKNLFGVVPGAVYGWPKNFLHFHGIQRAIVDLAATVRPGLAIVDGIVGMEGDGPIMGKPRPAGFIAMGTDPVAVDATCARAIGLDPLKIEYIRVAGEFLGHADADHIEHRGEPPSRYQYRFEVLPLFDEMRLG